MHPAQRLRFAAFHCFVPYFQKQNKKKKKKKKKKIIIIIIIIIIIKINGSVTRVVVLNFSRNLPENIALE